MKNRHLSKAIANQFLYKFKEKLTKQCKHHHIELRLVDRFYPSSKLCYQCGHKKVVMLGDTHEYKVISETTKNFR